jgi:hypothetical protein
MNPSDPVRESALRGLLRPLTDGEIERSIILITEANIVSTTYPADPHTEWPRVDGILPLDRYRA